MPGRTPQNVRDTLHVEQRGRFAGRPIPAAGIRPGGSISIVLHDLCSKKPSVSAEPVSAFQKEATGSAPSRLLAVF